MSYCLIRRADAYCHHIGIGPWKLQRLEMFVNIIFVICYDYFRISVLSGEIVFYLNAE